MANDLRQRGYEVVSEFEVQHRKIDMLARKGNHAFAIEIKNRPIETFDVVNSSTISVRIRRARNLDERNIIGVVTSDFSIPEEAKRWGAENGVILTKPSRLADSLERARSQENDDS